MIDIKDITYLEIKRDNVAEKDVDYSVLYAPFKSNSKVVDDVITFKGDYYQVIYEVLK